ncbi:MAG TPA: SMP-30/gluconolactonase/LRE family protein [Solirubrobacteraceae bacterium]|nr:SMP-30/gluconolactonase/LRE family protein [Solirubrobacteraceae bacterium]
MIEADVETFAALIDPEATLTQLGSGYKFTEGPVWHPRRRCLYFSDIPSDDRWRWSAEGGMELDAHMTFKANGLALDRDGLIVACESVSSCVVRIGDGVARELLAFHHRGRYLNSPNDIVVRGSDGSIYFTDPDYGRWNDYIGAQRSRELGFCGVYRIPPRADGGAQLLVDEHEFDQPNGLCFSPDESLLYVNDSDRATIKVFDVAADGTLGPAGIFASEIGRGFTKEDSQAVREAAHKDLHDAGAVDGMKCDEHGNVWVTGPGGVWVFDPSGRRIGRIRTPEVVGNLAFGGEDLSTLFLMTSSSVHSVPTRVASAPLAHH